MATLAHSFLIGYSSFLQVTRVCITAWMSFNFGQIRRLTTGLAALDRLKIQCIHFFSVAIDPILFNWINDVSLTNKT